MHKPIPLPCAYCGKMVMRHPCRLKKNKNTYCSTECRGKSTIGTKQSKETCEKRSAALSGENSSTWKGGVSRGYKRGYKSEQSKHWRTEVFNRDGYVCQNCSNAKNNYLTAHHIKSFANYPELRYEVSNGITLCEECHSERDHYYARLHPQYKKGA